MRDAPDSFMPLNIGLYLADTAHLNVAEHGAYLLLLMAYWRHGGPLVDDDVELRNIAKMSPLKWKKSRKRIRAFFFSIFIGGQACLGQKRAELELRKALELHDKKSKAGIAGNIKRWGNRIADGSHSDPGANRKSIADGIANASPVPIPLPLELKTSNQSSAPPTASPSPKPPDPKPQSQPKGRRWTAEDEIPPNWTFEAERLRAENNLPPINLPVENIKFTNYWIAKNGRAAAHLDWKRTYLNWILNANGAKNGNGSTPKRTSTDKHLAGIAQLVAERRAGQG